MAKPVKASVEVEVVTSGAQKAFDTLKKGAQKVGQTMTKAFKGVSGAVGSVFKGIKSLAIVGAIGGAITNAFKGNQKVVDAFNKVIQTVSIIFGEIAEAIIGVVGEQAALNGGFDATKKVLGGLISGVLNIFLGTIQSIKLGVLVAQRAWEDSFFGGGDQDKIKQLTEDINETKEALKQTGSAIVDAGKQVGSNFVEALEETAGAAAAIVQTVVDKAQTIDLKKAGEQADRIVRLQKAAALADTERQRIQLEFQRTAEQLRQLRDDDTKSLDVRKQANADLLALLEEQTKAEAEQIKIKIASAAASYDIESTNENLVALKQAQLELTDLQERLEGQRSEALSNQNALLREQTDIQRSTTEANLSLLEQQLSATAELADSEKQKLELQLQNIDIIKAARLAAIDEELAATTEGTARYAELLNQRNQVEADAANQSATTQKALDKEVLANKKATQDAIVGITQTGLTAISDLATIFAGDDEKRQKKAFELSKALQIAETTMSTYNAIVNALADKSVPGPVRIAQSVVMGAAGLASVLKIRNTKFSASESPSGAGAAQTAVPTNPNAALGGFQAGNNVVGPNEGPVYKTYVVADDVTSAQQANKKIKDLARL